MEDKDNLFIRLDKLDGKLEALLDREEPTLKYKIETSDKQEHYMAFHGSDFYFSLVDLDNYLRNTVKWSAEESGLDADTLQHCRDKLTEFMQDNGVDFEHVT